jgi:hypothetical protein
MFTPVTTLYEERRRERQPGLYTIIIRKSALLLLYFYFYHPSLNCYLIKNGFIITRKRIEHLFARVLRKEIAEKRNASFFCPLPARRAFCAFDAWNDERK